MSMFCSECEAEVEHVYVSGYHIGDRILEGIWFKVYHKPGDRMLTIEVVDGSWDDGYMGQLNRKYWEKRIVESVDDSGACLDCTEDEDLIKKEKE
jgi:hypothetical protein